MLCYKCGIALPLIEFNWIRLQRVTFARNGKEVVKGKIYEGKFNYTKWHTYCKECARKLTTTGSLKL